MIAPRRAYIHDRAKEEEDGELGQPAFHDTILPDRDLSSASRAMVHAPTAALVLNSRGRCRGELVITLLSPFLLLGRGGQGIANDVGEQSTRRVGRITGDAPAGLVKEGVADVFA